MTPGDQSNPPPPRRFAWDGVSFLLPDNWDLADYGFEKNQTFITIEDEWHKRLEGQWIRHKSRIDYEKVRRRFEKSSRKLTKAARESTEIRSLPTGWSAFLYEIEDDRLVLAFFLSPDDRAFFFFHLYFDSRDTDDPREILRLIAESMTLHEEAMTPWSLYDVRVEVPQRFRLVKTTLETGRKLLLFQWRGRKLYLWTFSLADVVLKDNVLEQWAAGFLSAYKEIRGVRFIPGTDGFVNVIRNRTRYPFGHFDEIGRFCFQYEIRCFHDKEANNICLSLYNYRKQTDLDLLPKKIFRRQAGR